MKQESIKKNIVLSTIYQILTVIIPFITAPYISRVIGDYGIGVYSYTNSIQTYFALFAALGTSSYGIREIARVRNDGDKRSKLFWEIELLSVITTLIMVGLWCLIILFSKQYKVYYFILTFNILVCAADISWFYAGLEQFKYTVLQNSIFKITGVILLFIFVKGPNDLAKYIAIMTGCNFLGTCSMWGYLKRFLVRTDFKKISIYPHFKETLVYFIPTIATSIYTVLDKTLIGVITKDAFQNGYYEQTTKIINMVKSITFSAVNSVIGSRAAFLFAEKHYEEIKRRIEDSLNYILFIGIASCFGIISVADCFVPVFFGEGYEPVINMLKIMSPIVIVIGISNCLGSQYYTPGGYRRKSAIYICLGAIVNLICNLIFIPYGGANGAIAGSLVAEGFITFLYIRNCDGYLKTQQIFSLMYKKIIAGLVMYAVLRIISSHMSYSIISLIIQIIVGALIYILTLILIKDSCLQMVRKIIKKV